MHLDDEQVQRLIHRELAPRLETEARDHLAACAGCRARAGEAEREEVSLFGLLGTLDHGPPPVNVQAIRSRAARQPAGWGRWAAGAVLALAGAGVAYAAPGSPLPALVNRAIEWVHPVARPRPPLPMPELDNAAGITVAPGRQLTIVFLRDRVGGSATIILTDSGDVVVRALSGAAAFSSGVDRLSVDVRSDSSRFEILIPRSAPSVVVRLRDHQVFGIRASRVTAGADTAGHYVIPLDRPK